MSDLENEVFDADFDEEFEDEDFDEFVQGGLNQAALENVGSYATIATTSGGTQIVGIPEGGTMSIASALQTLGIAVGTGNQYFVDGNAVPVSTEIGPGAFVTVIGTAKGG